MHRQHITCRDAEDVLSSILFAIILERMQVLRIIVFILAVVIVMHLLITLLTKMVLSISSMLIQRIIFHGIAEMAMASTVLLIQILLALKSFRLVQNTLRLKRMHYAISIRFYVIFAMRLLSFAKRLSL